MDLNREVESFFSESPQFVPATAPNICSKQTKILQLRRQLKQPCPVALINRAGADFSA
jgi:hypothetical protein